MASSKPSIVDVSKKQVVAAKKKKSAKDGMPCVMFLKGSEKGGVLIGSRGKPMPKAEIREQRKPFVGGPVLFGACYGIDGGIAFDLMGDPAKVKLPEAQKLKKVVNDFLETGYKKVRATLVSGADMGDLASDFGELGVWIVPR